MAVTVIVSKETLLPLLRAQAASLDRQERLDTLDLTLVNSKAGLDVAGSLVSAKVTLTIEGASTLELGIIDPDWQIEQSGLLDKDRNGRLDSVACSIDNLRWRLAKVARNDGHTLQLTFEDEVWALLRAHRKHIASSRDSMTRAQFIERMVREIRVRNVPYFAPEKGRKQPKELPELPDATPPGHSTGFDKGASFTIKGVKADADQMRSAATVMTVADQLDVTPRVRLAAVVAGIGESSFRKSATEHVYGTHHGVFQSNVIPASDLEGQARYFFQGGRSFLAGGAIKLARENPSMSVGTIAAKVEISDGSAGYYDSFHDEAQKIVDAWHGGGDDGGASTHEAVRVKSYRFTRGLPGQPENSAQAATRLADEVAWRFFVMGGVVWFVTDHWLIRRPAEHIITGFDAPGLMERPSYEWDHRKLAANMTLTVAADAWSVRPGSVVICHDLGPVTGRWVVESFEFDLLDPLVATVTLVQPVKPKKEPAPELFTVTVDEHGNTVTDDSIDAPSRGKVGNTYLGSPIPGQKWHSMTHQTGGLPGYPAYDYMAPAGTPVVAPETGTIRKLSGRDPGLGGSPGGPLGYSIYVHAPPRDYFMTHLDKVLVKVGQKVTQGEQIAEVANGPASWSTPHCHQGINGPTPPR